MENKVLTVSQVNSYIKLLFDGDKNLKNVFIIGEISNFKYNYSSGNLYFSLIEKGSSIKAVMFSENLRRLKFNPSDGMSVLVRGKVSVYGVCGQYQIYVEDMQVTGIGNISTGDEELKIKLEKEGLFDKERKKKIPKYPKKIGIITSISGAAIHDIENVIKRRYPVCFTEVMNVNVQGEKAADEILNAIEKFNSEGSKVDILIIARGGGAYEDLSIFNTENLVRAVAASNIPIISAVGHQTDWTLCDYVSDLRAPTPSAAAELACPDKSEIIFYLDTAKNRMKFAIKNKLNSENLRLDYVSKKIDVLFLKNRFFLQQEKINRLNDKLNYSLSKNLEKIKAKILNLQKRLDLAHPTKNLEKGYVMAYSKGKRITSVSETKKGKTIKILFLDGAVDVVVDSVRSGDFER